MTLQDLGSLGEFVGAIAVVVTLLYLAVQIRQNTRISQAMIRQNIATSVQAMILTGTESDALASILYRIGNSPDIAPEEQFRFNSFAIGQFFQWQNVYAQYREGFISDREWDAWANSMMTFFLFADPERHPWWEDAKSAQTFSPEFVTEVDSRLEGALESRRRLAGVRDG